MAFFYLSIEIVLYFRKIKSFVLLYSDNDKISFRSEIKYLMYLVFFFGAIPYSLSGPRGVAGRVLVSSAGGRDFGWCCALAFCSDAASAPHDRDRFQVGSVSISFRVSQLYRSGFRPNSH
jgi:hypothetical protein